MLLYKVAKKKTSAKPKKVASHPKYAEMIKDALANLKVGTLLVFAAD